MGLNSITSKTTLALDTNVFINAYEKSDKLGESARDIFEKISHFNPKVTISVLVLEEFLIKIYKKGLEKDIEQYENFINGDGRFMLIDVTQDIAKLAAKIRADYPTIKAPDAIHIASALEAKAKIFITTDRRLPKRIGKLEIKIL